MLSFLVADMISDKLQETFPTQRCAAPPGGALPHMGYIGMCRCEGYGFQAVYSGMRYINQRVRVIFQETDQLIEDFSLNSGNRKLKLKNIKKSNRFCFGWTVLVTSVVSGKQLL